MTTPTYYDRTTTVHLDGTPIFQTEADRKSEAEVAQSIEEAFRCKLHSWGELSPLDWYAVRFGRMVAVLELKTRTHAIGDFDTVYLNVRKWLAMQLASIGLGVPAFFVVRFTDDIRWISIDDIETRRHEIAGTNQIVKARSDIEPVIHVPVSKMQPLDFASVATSTN